MLEAFVYDPLISWRLLCEASKQSQKNEGTISLEVEVDIKQLSTNTIPSSQVNPPHKSQRSSVKSANSDCMEEVEKKKSFLVNQGILHKPIQEVYDENILETNEQSVHDTLLSSCLLPAQIKNIKSSLHEEKVKESHIEKLINSDMKSSYIYSHIQTLALNLCNLSHIASITSDDTERILAEGSIAQMKIDRSAKKRELMSHFGNEKILVNKEEIDKKALKVIRRVQDKLTGTDFQTLDKVCDPLGVQDKVQKLIVQATSTENLCQLFIGWCAFW